MNEKNKCRSSQMCIIIFVFVFVFCSCDLQSVVNNGQTRPAENVAQPAEVNESSVFMFGCNVDSYLPGISYCFESIKTYSRMADFNSKGQDFTFPYDQFVTNDDTIRQGYVFMIVALTVKTDADFVPCEQNISDIFLYLDKDSGYDFPRESAYFYLDTTEGASRSGNDYNTFCLPAASSSEIMIGWFVPSELIGTKKMLIGVGAKIEDCRYLSPEEMTDLQ